MKKLFFWMSVIFCSHLTADQNFTTNNRIVEIQFEIDLLQKLRSDLQHQDQYFRQQELREEMKAQPKMRDNQWNLFSQRMQSAEGYELGSEQKEVQIHLIDLKLISLADEINKLFLSKK